MAEGKQRPSWMVPAVVGVCILVFIAIAFVGGLGGRPRGDASLTRAVVVPEAAIRAVTGTVAGAALARGLS